MTAFPFRTTQSRRRVMGFTLIEVLVALIIFSLGMLGLAGLHIRMLSYGQSSLMRSQAAALTSDILDRMRVDRTNARRGDWDTTLTELAASIGSTATIPAEYDLKDWKDEVELLLPEGQASIAVAADASDNVTVTIVIRWKDTRGSDTTNATGYEQFVTVSRL